MKRTIDNLRGLGYRIIGYPSEFELNHQFLNLVMFLLCLVCLLSTFVNIYVGLTWKITVLIILAMGLSALGYYQARIKKSSTIPTGFFFVMAVFALPIVTWITNGGAFGSYPYFLGLVVTPIWLILRGKLRVAALIAYTVVVVSLLYLGYQHPEWIIGYTSRSAQLIDTVFAALITIFTGSLAVAIVMNAYDAKRLQLVEAHNRQLIQTEIASREMAQRELAEQTLKGAIILLTRATGLRSEETGEHIIRVPEYSYILAKFYGLNEKEAGAIRLVTPLHDIGKIGIPDTVLHKPGALTQEEYAIMKTHAQKGYEFFMDYLDNPFLLLAADIAYTHQEKWDGSGYPRRLKGAEIPVHGRIVAVADVFDALCQRRVYKEPMSVEKAIDIIRQGAGTHFEPLLVEIFLEKVDDILAIKEQYKDRY